MIVRVPVLSISMLFEMELIALTFCMVVIIGSPLPTPQDAPALVVTAEYQERPAQRVTLAPIVFNSARTVAFLVTGENKAAAVTATLHGQCDPFRWPAQRIHPDNGAITWWLDAGAAAQLPATKTTELEQ